MTKEKIIEIVNACVQYNANQGTWSIDNRFADELLTLVNIEKRIGEKKAEKLLNQIEELTTGKCALRCPLVEQEKKEVAREILNDLKGLLEGYIHTEDNISLYEYYCKKYGVEL